VKFLKRYLYPFALHLKPIISKQFDFNFSELEQKMKESKSNLNLLITDKFLFPKS
jgi:hypothetical protein